MRALALALFSLLAGCGGPPDVESFGWVVMGTTAQISFKTADGQCATLEGLAFGEVKDTFEEIERKLSIWRPDSEISRYVSLDQVSPETRPCYEAAFELQRASGGAFNPFWRGEGKGPDLGAIAKGFAVDLAAERLVRGRFKFRLGGVEKEADAEAIAKGIVTKLADAGGIGRELLIDLGGNLKAVRGTWRVGIRDPSRSGGIVKSIVLANGMACATSGEYERGKHIHDGRTGAAVTNDVASVTVVHPSSAMLADGLSTTLFVLGREKGEAFLKEHHPDATAYWVMRKGDK